MTLGRADWNYDEVPWMPFPHFVSRVQRQLAEVPGAPDVDLALRHIGAGVRPLTPDEEDAAHFGGGAHNVVSLVVSRLELLERLPPAGEEYLRGRWQSLYAYLALTCFDKLGQPSEWIDFRTWLTQGCGEVRLDRERAASEVQQMPPTQAAEQLFAAYNGKYGVRSSFRSFITNVLNPSDRRALLDCVRADWDDRPQVASENSDRRRAEYLYSIRNEYMHDLFFTSDAPPVEQVRRLDPKGQWDGFFMQRQYLDGRGRVITPMVRDWPMVLSRSVQRGLARWLCRRS